MATIRVEKNKNYSVISNTPLQDKNLSLKAKGLLALVFTLPDDWEYSINGIVKIVKESRDAVMTAFNELEKFGYMKRSRLRNSDGTLGETEYIFFENPIQNKQELDCEPKSEKPTLEKPILGKPTLENPIQQNTNKTKYLNKKNIRQQSKDCDTSPDDRNKKEFGSDSEPYKLACKLIDNVLEIRPKARVPKEPKDIQKWAEVFDKMIRIDKIDVEEIYQVLNYVLRNDFWSKNILSPASLRKNFDRLAIYATAENKKPVEKNKNYSVDNGMSNVAYNRFMNCGDFYE